MITSISARKPPAADAASAAAAAAAAAIEGLHLKETANTLFHDLNVMLVEYILLQQYKLVDNAASGPDKMNLTTGYLLGLGWSDETQSQLQTENTVLLVFRDKIADARRKLIAHADLRSRLEVDKTLGAFLRADELAFWASLQRFVNAAHDEAVGGPYDLSASMPDGDAVSLINRLADAADHDDLLREQPGLLRERIGKRRFDNL